MNNQNFEEKDFALNSNLLKIQKESPQFVNNGKLRNFS